MKKPEAFFDEDGNPCTRFVDQDPLTITEGWTRYQEIRRELARELLREYTISLTNAQVAFCQLLERIAEGEEDE